MPSVRTVGRRAFADSCELSEAEFGEELATLEEGALMNCHKLERIVLPLKGGMIEGDAFNFCLNLVTLGSPQHVESWRNEMNAEINCINQTLPTIRGKTDECSHRPPRSLQSCIPRIAEGGYDAA